MNAQLFTIPWGSPREAEVEPEARSTPSLEHPTADEIIAEPVKASEKSLSVELGRS